MEIDPSTGAKTKYIYAGDERIAMIDNAGAAHYYVKDHLGSTRYMVKDNGTVDAKYYRYTSYGATKSEMVSLSQAYKFTGKPLDPEAGLNLYYFGARYYNPAIGRWLAVDPLAGKYPGWSPYAYTLGNPIRLVDPNGKAPGDLFNSLDATAVDFGKTYNDDSIRKNREYGSSAYMTIDSKGGLKYSYTEARIGKSASVTPSSPRVGSPTVAILHTHAAYDPSLGSGNDVFSPDDKQIATNLSVSIYVATPSGSLQVFNPKTGKITTSSTSMASDPNDPNRLNNVDPNGNKKDDDTYSGWDALSDFIYNLLNKENNSAKKEK